MEKKKKAAVLLKEILEKKPRTSEEFREEANKRGIRRANFFTQRKILLVRGEIKYLSDVGTGEKTWTILAKGDKANLNDIGLCFDEMNSNDGRLRTLGADEFVHLCQTKSVIHDPRVRPFFKKTFHDGSFKDVHERLLLAFKYVLVRTLQDGNDELFRCLLEENKETITKFATAIPVKREKKGVDADSIRLKKKAFYVLALAKNKEVLDILYDVIEKSSAEEYSMLKAEILDIFRSYPLESRSEIKRGVFRIATKENTKEELIDRALNLLNGLSDARVSILA